MRPATTRSAITTPMVLAISPFLSFRLVVARTRSSPLLLEARQAVDAIKRRRLVAFRQSGVVEHSVDKVVHCSAQRHHRLADVQQFRCAFADDMYAQNRPGLAVEDQL